MRALATSELINSKLIRKAEDIDRKGFRASGLNARFQYVHRRTSKQSEQEAKITEAEDSSQSS